VTATEIYWGLSVQNFIQICLDLAFFIVQSLEVSFFYRTQCSFIFCKLK